MFTAQQWFLLHNSNNSLHSFCFKNLQTQGRQGTEEDKLNIGQMCIPINNRKSACDVAYVFVLVFEKFGAKTKRLHVLINIPGQERSPAQKTLNSYRMWCEICEKITKMRASIVCPCRKCVWLVASRQATCVDLGINNRI